MSRCSRTCCRPPGTNRWCCVAGWPPAGVATLSNGSGRVAGHCSWSRPVLMSGRASTAPPRHAVPGRADRVQRAARAVRRPSAARGTWQTCRRGARLSRHRDRRARILAAQAHARLPEPGLPRPEHDPAPPTTALGLSRPLPAEADDRTALQHGCNVVNPGCRARAAGSTACTCVPSRTSTAPCVPAATPSSGS